MERKIDNILTVITNLTDTNVNLVKRIARLEEKLHKYDDNIAEFNKKLAKQEHKIKNISDDLEEKLFLTDYHELRDRIARLEFEKKSKKIGITTRVLLQKAKPSHSWFIRGQFLCMGN